jgi:hypothetical protein
MSTTDRSPSAAIEAPDVAPAPARFEVTTLPVADVDRAKAFYQRLSWRLDIDFRPTRRLAGGSSPRRARRRRSSSGRARRR